MADITSICNQALAAVGTRTTIASIDEASNEARRCKLQYEPTRRHLLRAAHWGFARSYTMPPILRAHRSTPEALTPKDITNPTGEGSYWPGWDQRYEPPPPWLYSYNATGMFTIRYITPLQDTTQPKIPFTSAPADAFPSLNLGPMPKYEMAQDSPPNNAFVKVKAILTNISKAVVCYTDDVSDPNLFDEGFIRAFVSGLAANMAYTLTGDLKLVDALFKLTNNLILSARVASANESLNVNDVVPDWYRVRGVGPTVGTGPWIPEYGPLFGGSI